MTTTIRSLHAAAICELLAPRRSRPSPPLHLFICVADHFEPNRGNAPLAVQRDRVDRWIEDYPKSVAGIADSLGRSPQHTFFYPAEAYLPEHLDKLAGLCHRGFGEVEVHLHHDNDTSDNLRQTLEQFKEHLYFRHGLLHKDAAGCIRYGFIHGNWALDNCRPDGRWCGVNDELTVLRETGCYADFTLPCAPAPGQTRIINSIYYATDDPERPKSHDRGIVVERNRRPRSDSLLMIQGPLTLDWQRRKFGLLPRIENGNLDALRPPTLDRLKLWLKVSPEVKGNPHWRFVKLHTHGAHEANAAMLLGEPMRRFHEQLAAFAKRETDIRYYYVTAREMANLVHQAEAGATRPSFEPQTAQIAAT